MSREFLTDQRTFRLMTLPLNLKITFTPKIESTVAKPTAVKRRVLKRKSVELHSVHDAPSKKKYNTTKIDNLALAADRYQVSDRAAAALASATLCDLGIINIAANETTKIIDKNKVRRAKDSIRFSLNKSISTYTIKGLFFDGRKDRTLRMEDGRKKYVTELHITLLAVPGYKYLGHTLPATGSAEDILRSVLNFFELKEIGLEELRMVGCDGTITNTGWLGGVMTLLEKHLQRPLQRMVCLLHFNELPLRHLIEELDGPTDGPESFSGELGVLLKHCTELPIVAFKSINCELPLINKKDLSTDQRYLHDMCSAISEGICTTNLSKRDPGKIVHSRWLTTANRYLRVYVSTKTPTKNLITIVTFILKVLHYGSKLKQNNLALMAPNMFTNKSN